VSEPVLGPDDRPWAAREYGRIRVNESLAGELLQILTETLDNLHEVRISLKETERGLTEINRRIRRAGVLRNLLHGMMHEKGWCACAE
jgi:hypothetical protein